MFKRVSPSTVLKIGTLFVIQYAPRPDYWLYDEFMTENSNWHWRSPTKHPLPVGCFFSWPDWCPFPRIVWIFSKISPLLRFKITNTHVGVQLYIKKHENVGKSWDHLSINVTSTSFSSSSKYIYPVIRISLQQCDDLRL